MAKPSPIILNFKDIRNVRQKNNNTMVYSSIKNNNIELFYNSINKKELERILEDLNIKVVDLFVKCNQDDLFCKLLSRSLSKNASRQGSKDEVEQLKTCNFICEMCGINIVNLSANAIRPTKMGEIITHVEQKRRQISKDNCLKSFDGKFNGKINGFITAKVAFGSGGHQDNVFEEMDCLADWWSKYKKDSIDYLLILIDTDLIEKFNIIKKKYNSIKNILVFNHVNFQEFVINNYFEDNK